MKPIRLLPVVAVAAVFAAPIHAEETPPLRNLTIADVLALKAVLDPQLSPDGKWVAYTVRSSDSKEDQVDTDVYMAPVDRSAGSEAIRLTASPKSESSPRWSPDGRYLAFLSEREGDKSQVWLLDRRGGEAVKLTDVKSGVEDLAWAPDGKRLALIVGDADPDEVGEDAKGAAKTPRPIVIRRRQFKRDGAGYLRELRSHLYVFDLATRSNIQLTTGPYDESEPRWSPDGRWIAFTSNRTEDPDANQNSDVFVIEAKAGAAPRAVTTSPGTDQSPAWSPDGKWIAYVAGGSVADLWYATSHLAVVPAQAEAGKETGRPLTRELDRNVFKPTFSADGRHVYFVVEDGGNQHVARVPVAGGKVERIVAGEREVEGYEVGRRGEVVVAESQWDYPAEISVQEPGKAELRRITHTNDAVLRGLRLGRVQRFKTQAAGGPSIDGFLTLPPGYEPGTSGRRLPTILRIHGGPVSQFTTGFEPEWQVLAAHGYAVVAANPRGSSGYGRDFSYALFADWGNPDTQDVLAAVDAVIAQGVADPDRLGVGGWSYGGILTNYVITKTQRFKAATSGASETNYLANYGTDHYQYEWETELGLPWKNTDLWLRLSPWFQVEKITTPTLILCGEKDVNVPLLNSEQLYQALRRLGRETELVIYPGQHHGITKPSYVKDRYERYLSWYDRWLGAPAPASAGQP